MHYSNLLLLQQALAKVLLNIMLADECPFSTKKFPGQSSWVLTGQSEHPLYFSSTPRTANVIQTRRRSLVILHVTDSSKTEKMGDVKAVVKFTIIHYRASVMLHLVSEARKVVTEDSRSTRAEKRKSLLHKSDGGQLRHGVQSQTICFTQSLTKWSIDNMIGLSPYLHYNQSGMFRAKTPPRWPGTSWRSSFGAQELNQQGKQRDWFFLVPQKGSCVLGPIPAVAKGC